MTEFLLTSKNDDRQTKFSGELVSRVEKPICLDDDYHRYVGLTVYSIDGGGFVVETRFESGHPDEQDFAEIEILDEFDDVDKFFYLFELNENLCSPHGLTRAEREAHHRRVKLIKRHYERILFPFLDEVKTAVVSRGLANRHTEPKKPSFWDLFRSSAS